MLTVKTPMKNNRYHKRKEYFMSNLYEAFLQEQIIEMIQNSNSFAILTHERPDGDAIASSLAIYWYIKSVLDKADIDIIIPESPKNFSFLPGFENIKTKPSREKYDLLIIVDELETSRIKCYDVVSSRCLQTLLFDHHKGSSAFKKHNSAVIGDFLPSTTAVLLAVFGNVSKEFLECVVTGILSDTKNLTVNTNDVTVCTVGALGKLGVDVEKFKKLVGN